MNENEAPESDIERTRSELDSAEDVDDAARVELLERIHDELEKELDTDVDQESPSGR